MSAVWLLPNWHTLCGEQGAVQRSIYTAMVPQAGITIGLLVLIKSAFPPMAYNMLIGGLFIYLGIRTSIICRFAKGRRIII